MSKFSIIQYKKLIYFRINDVQNKNEIFMKIFCRL